MIETLSLAVQSGVPTLLWGAPGTGKSSTVMALAQSLCIPVEVVIASIREPSDFGGLPVLSEDGVRLHAPAWATRLARAGCGILFLDEISTAPPAVQAALLRVVLDRAAGDLELPPTVSIIAAANPPEQAAGGWDLTPPLANRFLHLNWPTDAHAWADGMIAGWPIPTVRRIPAGWESLIPQTRAMVAAFIRTRPQLLLNVPREEVAAGRAWPSPRSWDMAARLIAAAKSISADDHELIAGAVGDPAAAEFISWRQAADLPDPELLLANPDAFVMPKRGDITYAVLASVTAAALSKLTPPRWAAAWAILGKAADQGGVDCAAIAARQLAHARGTLPLPAEVGKFVPILKAGGLL